MENKVQSDTNLRAMLNSPARFTPAVPTPDWNSTTPSQPTPSQPAPVSLYKKNYNFDKDITH